MIPKRSSGILLPLNALPRGSAGIGTIGKEARLFIDFLKKAKQKYWQICPLGHIGKENSPYICFSAFAGNPYLIDLHNLFERGWLVKQDLQPLSRKKNYLDYQAIKPFCMRKLFKAYDNFQAAPDSKTKKQILNFKQKNSYWIYDYALFMALADHFETTNWSMWQPEIKYRNKAALEKKKNELAYQIDFYIFVQYVFFDQWERLKKYATENQIQIIGDVPIYVSFESADVWAHPKQFQLDKNLRPTHVAGVPPDYFSKTGQLWGNPLYDWNYMQRDKFSWWCQVFSHLTKCFDLTRIDHFRGLCAYWSIPANAPNAISGKWIKVPGKKFISAVQKKLQGLPFFAEDLGLITDDVIELREYFGFPSMQILQFAFDANEKEQSLPFNYNKNCVVYTGTHDNDTSLGHFRSLDKKTRNFALKYLNSSPKDYVWSLIREAWKSPCILAVVPMQDLLELGSEARTNTPGSFKNIYRWHLEKNQLKETVAKRLANLTMLYHR